MGTQRPRAQVPLAQWMPPDQGRNADADHHCGQGTVALLCLLSAERIMAEHDELQRCVLSILCRPSDLQLMESWRWRR